jgi:hypothetical protein
MTYLQEKVVILGHPVLNVWQVLDRDAYWDKNFFDNM